MGLGETQVFQDEKSRLANTTVARIVAAKGSLNDPETKKECCRIGAAGAATRRRHAGRAAGPAAALCRPATSWLGGEDGTRRPHLLPEQQRKTHDLDETAAGGAHPDGHRYRGAAPGDVPGDLSARRRAGLAPARPRAEHGPGDDGHRARGRRCDAAS